MHLMGKVIHQDNDRVIELVKKSNESKEYRIHQMKRNCTYCNKRVHKDSGGLLMSIKVNKLKLPKFFCAKHYVETKELLSRLK
mgnify:CR=1 FL=1